MNELITLEKELPSFNNNYYENFIAFLDVGEKSKKTYTSNLKQFAAWIQKQGIQKPTRKDILDYKEYLKSRFKATTVNTNLIVVKLFFRWLYQEGLYENVADNIKGEKVDKNFKKDYLTSNQVKEMLKQVDLSLPTGKRDYAILLLMVTCGLRDIEINRANINDIVTVGDNRVLLIQGKGKNEKSDYVKLPDLTEQAINEYLAYRPVVDKEAALFTSNSNNSKTNRLSTRSISAIAKKYMIQANLNSERLTAHSLRHTAITLSLIGGNTIQEAQQFARHSNINTTLIYAHNLDKMKNNCSNTVASLIG